MGARVRAWKKLLAALILAPFVAAFVLVLWMPLLIIGVVLALVWATATLGEST